MPKRLADGSILEERYVIKQKIGDGGMSDVYLVWDSKLSKYWAVKRIVLKEWKKLSFYREMELLKRVNHPAFPVMVDWFVEEEYGYIVMEWIQGETLEQLLKRIKRLKLSQARKVMTDLMDALEYLHGLTPPIVYGDLKPANIMIQKDGRVRIVDFGTACREASGYQMGTRGYAAPELLGTVKGVPDARSDIYSFGAVFYELLTGERFNGDYLANPFLPWQIREVIFQCTRVSQRERYASLGAVREAMDQKDKVRKKRQFLLRDCEKVILSERNFPESSSELKEERYEE